MLYSDISHQEQHYSEIDLPHPHFLTYLLDDATELSGAALYRSSSISYGAEIRVFHFFHYAIGIIDIFRKGG